MRFSDLPGAWLQLFAFPAFLCSSNTSLSQQKRSEAEVKHTPVYFLANHHLLTSLAAGILFVTH